MLQHTQSSNCYIKPWPNNFSLAFIKYILAGIYCVYTCISFLYTSHNRKATYIFSKPTQETNTALNLVSTDPASPCMIKA